MMRKGPAARKVGRPAAPRPVINRPVANRPIVAGPRRRIGGGGCLRTIMSFVFMLVVLAVIYFVFLR